MNDNENSNIILDVDRKNFNFAVWVKVVSE